MKTGVRAKDAAGKILQEMLDLPSNVIKDMQLEVEKASYTLHFDEKCLFLPNVFFSRASTQWLSKDSLPKLPLEQFQPEQGKALPVIFGDLSREPNENYFPIDLFGSLFFLLSRYEEAVLEDKDAHDRFPSIASLAYRADFLHRPLVEEYVDVFWEYVRKVWPGMVRQLRTSRTLVSCDVDVPRDPSANSLYATARKALGKVIKQGSIPQVTQAVSNYLHTRKGSLAKDPCRQGIEWIMDANDEAGNQVTFNFIPRQSHPRLDHPFPMDSPEIRELLRYIHQRGHLIGFHPGYVTCNNPVNFKAGADLFWQVIEEENIRQDRFGGRQHFLKWHHPETAELWEKNGFDYDSSLGFADRAGFRCGTCREFRMFSLDSNQCSMKLNQQPLVLMECTVMAERYMGLGHSEKALDFMLSLKDTCRKYRGDFTLLWHNTELSTPEEREIYRQLIQTGV
jgi:hypothetical protein